MEQNVSLRLLVANIEKYRHFERFTPLCLREDPEVILLQEVPLNGLCRLAKSVGASRYFFVPMARATFPDGAEEVMGLAILLRLKNKNDGVVSYGEFSYHLGARDGNNLPVFHKSKNFSCDNFVQHIEVMKDNMIFGFGNTHFPWTPDGKPNPVQFECMPKIIAYAKPRRLIICGDLNAPRLAKNGSKGPIWAMLANEFHDNIPPEVISTLDPFLHRTSVDGISLPLVVDALFTPREYRAENVVVHAGVSDHKPISAVIHRVS